MSASSPPPVAHAAAGCEQVRPQPAAQPPPLRVPASARALLGTRAGAHLWTACVAIDDVVMGGLSSSHLRVPRVAAAAAAGAPEVPLDSFAGAAVFEGTVRTENFGGFASIRCRLAAPAVAAAAECDALLLHVRGDGRAYSLRAFVGDGADQAYEARFATRRGQRDEIFVPLGSMRARWRGRDVPGAPPLRRVGDVRAIGLMALKSDVVGDFALEVADVFAVGGPG